MSPLPPSSSIELHLLPRSLQFNRAVPAVVAIAQKLLPRSAQQPSASSPALAPLQPLGALDVPHHQLTRRQTETVFIPLIYKNLDSGPTPGAIVGIVIGSIAGFLLAVWLVMTLTSSRRTGLIEGDRDESELYIHHRSRSPPRRRKRRSRRSHTVRSEVSEHREEPPPPPRHISPEPPRRRTERIIVEETRRTERSQPPPPVPPPMSEHIERERESEFVEEREVERRVEGDDVVEVIEEHSDVTAESARPDPPRRKKSGYRTVDPNAYGGGNFAQRDIHESSRRRSSRR